MAGLRLAHGSPDPTINPYNEMPRMSPALASRKFFMPTIFHLYRLIDRECIETGGLQGEVCSTADSGQLTRVAMMLTFMRCGDDVNLHEVGSAARDPHGIKQITVGPPHGIKQITMFIRENVECLDSSFTTTTTIKILQGEPVNHTEHYVPFAKHDGHSEG
ncbi:hypothetical protein J6590_052562 [Homalodisca vitripennis]|nr:hypothetical protein J6590_052562 [Homalodisca vitripennis]